ncbi:LysR family transcriptional regulator [Marinobacterium rhizophilum]|uniref:LysR family transcriptional regulator n=1 Tax=Marinobacterium rhizophilum TaxID=420402 RepID=UPI0003A945CE|nr:LysR family transcriptional regulator [Marinobacterium rhizophilum]
MSAYSMKHMQTFCMVVEYGGFVGAQSALGMSQPAISTHIRDFEIRLGFQLCHRGRSGFSLTEKGEVVYRKCREMLNSISDFEADLGELRNTLTGTLRVGLVDNVITNRDLPVADAIHRFYSRSNDVSIKLLVLAPEDLERELLTGNIHLAIGLFQNRSSAMTYRHLCSEHHGFYCGRRHPLFERPAQEISVETIRQFPISSRTYLQHADLQHIKKSRNVAFVSNMEAQAILITSGSFLGFLPTHYAHQWVESGEMRALDHLNLSWESEFSLAVRASPAPQNIVQVFVKDIEAALGALAQK